MMLERLPEPQEPEFKLYDRTPSEWHAWLTTDRRTGEDAGHLDVPCSRYGRTSAEVAWSAIAAISIYYEYMGEPDDVEAFAEHAMSLVVNDDDSIEHLIRDNIDLVADEIKQHLDVEGGDA